ncbi:carbohydrate ABC transporter substrate-binding protein [Actinomyces johnsonii]|uniref:Carbohydrate ABC transporter substrate-binding protein n=1 Tax=Actinomyces johnsonii TaxID=544581 RepID=A0A508A3M0_9ACTO|nr:ABC transporter substrate-binding protein [Actinomyces johnsonii]KAA8738347.1 carbohydrate ABC transporter substrate-binding protein [Actinomyces johnsonii]TQD41535.1 carbohydrate ABC transporter substrate-binding protein [Actinomyces johnsonii]
MRQSPLPISHHNSIGPINDVTAAGTGLPGGAAPVRRRSTGRRRRCGRLLAAASALTLVCAATAACSAGGAHSASATGCAAYKAYQGHEGSTVTVSSSLTGTEAERFEASVAEFEKCTGIDVAHTGTTELRSQLLNGSGADLSTNKGASPSSQDNPENLPDLAIVPQPAMVAELVDTGVVHPLPNTVNSNVEAGWDRHWIQVGIHASVPYAAPLMASVKSLVWYSPDAFAKAGYKVPATWAELETLTRKVRADHPDGSVTPWCVGASDGESTGWVMTDWLEDAMLSTQGSGAYETWASHRVPVDSSGAVEALDVVDSLVLADGSVAGGRGSVISRTPAQAGADLVKGSCLMLHASSSFESRFPEGTAITDADGANPVTVQAPSPTGGATASTDSAQAAGETTAAATASPTSNGVKISAFVTPAADRGSEAVLVGTDYLVAFTRSDAANAVMAYLTSQNWARTRMAMGGVATAYQGVDPDLAPSDVGKRATRLLQSRQTTVEMDASDSMPVGVGSSALWLGLSRWSTGAMTPKEALAQGESAWPKQK